MEDYTEELWDLNDDEALSRMDMWPLSGENVSFWLQGCQLYVMLKSNDPSFISSCIWQVEFAEHESQDDRQDDPDDISYHSSVYIEVPEL